MYNTYIFYGWIHIEWSEFLENRQNILCRKHNNQVIYFGGRLIERANKRTIQIQMDEHGMTHIPKY